MRIVLFNIFEYRLIIYIIVVSLLFAGRVEYISEPYFTSAFAQNSNKMGNQTNLLSLETILQNGAPYLGNLTSPITLMDFSDFQCYLCNRFVQNTEPLLNETYVQGGKVVLVFKHLPNRGLDSVDAALAAQCTNDQGKFWQFHDLLYDNQKQIDSGWVSKDNLKKFALLIAGLDIQKFNSCLDNEKYKVYIENDIRLASSFGFRETPSFILVNRDGSNPEFLQGALPFASFKAVIDNMLSKSEKSYQ